MPIPDYIVALRSKIGHDPIPLPGVTSVVLDDRDRILLVRRADNGRWTLVTGCLEPGEQPAVGAVREIFEETAVEAVVERLVGVDSTDLMVCANGDQVYWHNITFRCRAVSGDARVNDDESVEVGWFDSADLPELSPRQAGQVAQALDETAPPSFAVPERQPARRRTA